MKAPENCNSDKKRLHCRCFPENFPKCLRTTFLQNTSRRLILDIFIHLTTYFLWPSSELIETRLFYICKHNISRLSSVMNIMSLAFGKLYENKRPIEAAVRLCFSEQVFLKISQDSHVFSREIYEMFKITFFYNSPPVAAS